MPRHQSPEGIVGSYRTPSGLEVVVHRRELTDAEFPPDKLAAVERIDSLVSGLVQGIEVAPNHLALFAVEARIKQHRQLVGYALENLPQREDGVEDTRVLTSVKVQRAGMDIQDMRIGMRYTIDLPRKLAQMATFYGENYSSDGYDVMAGITHAFAQTLRASGEATTLDPDLYAGGSGESLPTINI